MKTTFLCEYLIYAIKHFAINRNIFLMCEWFWFGMTES